MDHLMIAALAAQQMREHSEYALAAGLAKPGRGVPGKDFCGNGQHVPDGECDCLPCGCSAGMCYCD